MIFEHCAPREGILMFYQKSIVWKLALPLPVILVGFLLSPGSSYLAW